MKLFRSLAASIRSLVALSVFGFKIVVGVLVFAGAIRFLNSPVWESLLVRGVDQVAAIENLKPAVNVTGGVFIVTWLLRFWEQVFPKAGFTNRWGLKTAGSLNFFQWFLSIFVHGNYNHLRSNTIYLLPYMGLAMLILPTVQSFIVVTAVLVLIGGIGTRFFGKLGNHIGASGMVLGYYSFDVFYSTFVVRTWWGILLAVILILWRGRHTWGVLRNDSPHISVAGHAFGFVGGIIAAAVTARLLL